MLLNANRFGRCEEDVRRTSELPRSILPPPTMHSSACGSSSGLNSLLPGVSHRDTVRNQLLRQIDKDEAPAILTSLEYVRLSVHQMLHESGEAIRSVYFLNEGLASVLAVEQHGKSVEVGVIGNEGFIGFPIVFGFKTSSGRVITQCEATAYRIEARRLQNLLVKCPKFGLALQRYAVILGAQSAQLAACNRMHEVDERLSRWLLMSHDRIGHTTLPLTQDFLAQMLGTRRSTVSTSASILQKAGIISYTRGNVTIIDRIKLEQAACECYRIMQHQIRSWRSESGELESV